MGKLSKKFKTIGIIGGMGPEATVDMFRAIVKLTPAEKDQDHIPILIYNNPQIPDRNGPILNTGPSPLPEIIQTAQRLEKAKADFLIMPCNAASAYMEELRNSVKIPIISIVEETARYLIEHHPHVNRVGLMGIEATLRSGIYQKYLIEKHLESKSGSQVDVKFINQIIPKIRSSYYHFVGYKSNKSSSTLHAGTFPQAKRIKKGLDFGVILPSMEIQHQKVHKAFFGKRGVKAGYYNGPKKLFISCVRELVKNGAQAVVMGCTEIPLALEQDDVEPLLINPTTILAQATVDIGLGNRQL